MSDDVRGLTFIEVLVTALLLALVVAGLMPMLTSGQKTWEYARRSTGMVQNARIALDRLVREMRAAQTFQNLSSTLIGFVLYSNQGTLSPPWWNASWSCRRRITVSTGSSSTSSGYSVALTFDHASYVTAGKALSSGNDVRVVYWNGSSWVELDRVLDSGSAWNSANTNTWFRTQAAIGANASDSNYFLYYCNAAAGPPPANKSNVFLYFDDFELGNLSRWTIVGGLWQVATDRPRTGTYSLKYPTDTVSNQWILANPALNEANVYVDAWWNFNVLDPVNDIPDIAQVFRANTLSNGYETNLEAQSSTREGWDMAKFISGTWTLLSTDTVSTAATNTWTRIGIAIYGTGMRIFKDGAQINPASGSFNVGTELASGNIGFRKYDTGTGAWWIDDAVARKYVDPEPASSLGSEETNNPTVTVEYQLNGVTSELEYRWVPNAFQPFAGLFRSMSVVCFDAANASISCSTPSSVRSVQVSLVAMDPSGIVPDITVTSRAYRRVP